MLHRYLSTDEQQRLIKAASQPADILARRDAAWLQALLISGMRIKEFSLITLGDAILALRTKYLFIPKANRKGGKSDHRVFITAPLHKAFSSLIAIRYEMTGDDCSHVDDPLIISRQHADPSKPMSVRSYELRFKHWAKLADLPADASPHWLRHSRAINIMRTSQASDPRGVAQAALGHASIASTGIYTQVLREDMENALTQTDAGQGKRVSLAALRKDFDRRN
jgi:site-specific recombinase XerD